MRFAIALFASALSAAAQNPFAGNAQAADMGRSMFRLSCAPCHGFKATGGRGGPDLTRGVYMAGDRDNDLFNVIAGGVPGTPMPGFGGDLTNDMIWRMVTFIRSTARPDEAAAVPGDAAAGEKVFWGKGGCGGCHRVSNRGGYLGPDLTRVGRQRPSAYLRVSIISPSAELTPGYTTLKVVTRDGKTITGIEKNMDNFSALLMDSSGAYQSYLKSDVGSIARDYTSLMPVGYDQRLTAGEIDDLVAYMVNLRGKQ